MRRKRLVIKKRFYAGVHHNDSNNDSDCVLESSILSDELVASWGR